MDVVKESSVFKIAESAKRASATLAALSDEARNNALIGLAQALEKNADKIALENLKDLEESKNKLERGELNSSLYQRLKLDKEKIISTCKGIRQIAEMPDPLGKISLARELDRELNLYRISCPIGVLAVIFEARPEAMPQILSLAIKTGNACILKGGSEAENSNRILFKIMQEGLRNAGLPESAYALIETRSDVKEMLAADRCIDLVIPRGSNELVRFVQNNTRIPVLGHADGICHIYVHEDACIEKALALVMDSKTQYPAACNSLETLLVHKNLLASFLPELCLKLQEKKVELRMDETCLQQLHRLCSESGKEKSSELAVSQVRKAQDKDWSTEYCDLILSIKCVDSMQEAIEHINHYGSGHTESMITKSRSSFEEFFQKVNAAGVYMNASTRFADGFRYGFGAEVGISTSKLHPRGPVGLEGLVTYKYKLIGNGQLVGDYSGPQAKPFTHRDLPSS